MRLVAVLGAICALTQTASAEIGDCSALQDAAAQLACYNNEPPPKTVRSTPARSSARIRPDVAKPPAVGAGGVKPIDQLSDDDVAVNAKVRSLCRGC
jgi:hypothetical protein